MRTPSDAASSNKVFCSNNCSAKHNNRHRDPEVYKRAKVKLLETWALKRKDPAKPTKQNKVQGKPVPPKAIVPPTIRMKQTAEEKSQRRRAHRLRKTYGEAWGPYSKLVRCTCAHTGKIFFSACYRKYHPDCQHLYSEGARAKYEFTFNVYNYPDLFDLEGLNRYGWYNSGGGRGKRKKPINISGWSRDHRVSITDAIENNFNPFYIKHPLNCELMPQSENFRKRGMSSMAYDELVMMVDAYEDNLRQPTT